MGEVKVMEISKGIAESVKVCRPKVISSYPITPQTHIVEHLAELVAEGELDAQYVWADSEFAAASIVCGASATGVRTYTASSSQGLLLMTEVLWNIAGLRLPVVLTGANRFVSAPISIEVDHQDSLSFRDSGVIQIYVEEAQETYDATIIAYRLAEDPEILLPAILCVDGWALTHAYEPIELLDQDIVDSFLPPYNPPQYLTPEKPLTFGNWGDDTVLMETRYMMHLAMETAKKKFKEVSREFAKITGHDYGGTVEEYKIEDAEICLIAMGSICGVIKDAIDELRGEGVKAGLAKIRLFRPFPGDEIARVAKNVRCVVTLDRGISLGSQGILALDVKGCLYGLDEKPLVLCCIAGLGGKEITKDVVRSIVSKAQKAIMDGKVEEKIEWISLSYE